MHVNLSRLRSSGFLHADVVLWQLPSRRHCALAVAFTAPTHAYLRTFGLHEIFKLTRLKFTVYGC